MTPRLEGTRACRSRRRTRTGRATATSSATRCRSIRRWAAARLDIPPLQLTTGPYIEPLWTQGTEDDATALDTECARPTCSSPIATPPSRRVGTSPGRGRSSARATRASCTARRSGTAAAVSARGRAAGDIVTLRGCTADTDVPRDGLRPRTVARSGARRSTRSPGLCMSENLWRRNKAGVRPVRRQPAPLRNREGQRGRADARASPRRGRPFQPDAVPHHRHGLRRRRPAAAEPVAPWRSGRMTGTGGAGGRNGAAGRVVRRLGGDGRQRRGAGGVAARRGPGRTGGVGRPRPEDDCQRSDRQQHRAFKCVQCRSETRCLNPCVQDQDCRHGRVCLRKCEQNTDCPSDVVQHHRRRCARQTRHDACNGVDANACNPRGRVSPARPVSTGSASSRASARTGPPLGSRPVLSAAHVVSDQRRTRASWSPGTQAGSYAVRARSRPAARATR